MASKNTISFFQAILV